MDRGTGGHEDVDTDVHRAAIGRRMRPRAECAIRVEWTRLAVSPEPDGVPGVLRAKRSRLIVAEHEWIARHRRFRHRQRADRRIAELHAHHGRETRARAAEP